MNQFRSFVFLAVSTLLFLSTEKAAAVIYGADSRVEVTKDPVTAELAKSILVAVPNQFVQKKSTTFDLDVLPMEHPSNFGVCSSVPFAKQVAFQPTCTGFLVAPDLLVTAGHCMVWLDEVQDTNLKPDHAGMTTPFCTDFSWVMDYVGDDKTFSKKNIPLEKVVGCKQVVYASAKEIQPGNFKIDAALIRLDRALDRKPLTLSPEKPKASASLSMIGFPMGVTAKFSSGARVLDPTPELFFRTNLDSMGGNSGSPVFDEKFRVVGILVRGYPDDFLFDDKNKCLDIHRCDEAATECSGETTFDRPGEHVQRLDPILKILKQILR